jgi:hypothetical protein
MSMTTPYWMTLLSQLVFYTPVLVVFVVGALLAIVRWGKHPRASSFALAGFVVLVANALLMMTLQALLWDSSSSGGWTAAQTSTLMTVVGVIRTSINVVGFALLVSAIFVERSPSQSRRREPELFDGPRTSVAGTAPPVGETETAFRERKP